MDDTTYTKGIYTATATVCPADGGQFQGMVALVCDQGDALENLIYTVEATAGTEEEALDEAKELAQRILGEIEL